MPIKFTCPNCKKVLQLPDSMAGKSGKCKCGHKVAIPAAAAVAGAGSSAAARQNSAMFDELMDSDFSRQSPLEQLYGDKGENTDATTLQRFTQDEVEEKKRQAKATAGLLKLVAILQILISIACIAMIVFFAGMPDVLERIGGYLPLARVGAGLGIALFSILAICSLAGGIGLFMSKSWGWILTAIISDFLVIERLGAMGVVIKEGFNQSAFFGAMGPGMAVLFMTLLVFNNTSQGLCGIKNKVPMIIAIVVGFALGIGAVVAVFQSI